MPSISTRKGDTGNTGLGGGQRVSKGDLRVEAYGSIDELNTVIGVARAGCDDPQVGTLVRSIQRELFAVGSAVSTKPGSRREIPVIGKPMVARLDEMVEVMEAEPGILRDWSLPGRVPGLGRLRFRIVRWRGEPSGMWFVSSPPAKRSSRPCLSI